jgi:putative membrane protein
MLRFLLRALVAAIGFWISARLLHGVHVGGPASLVAAGLLLGVINALVRPVLIIITIPLTIVTLGLFLLVVNGISVWLVTLFLHGIRMHGPLDAILTALIISLASWAAGGLIDRFDGRGRYRRA